MTGTDLRLFGAIHADKREKVADELDEFAEGVDALFVEYPAEGTGPRPFARMWLRSPLVALGFALVTLAHLPLYAICQRSPFPAELIAARELAQERDLPLHPVDADHPVAAFGDASRSMTAVNWILFALLVAYAPVGTLATAAVLVGSVLALGLLYRVIPRVWPVLAVVGCLATLWALIFASWTSGVAAVVGLLFALVAIYATLGDRNETMLSHIERISNEHGYRDACLTTGKAHLSGLRESAESYDVRVTAEHDPRWLRYASEADDETNESETTEKQYDREPSVLQDRVHATIADWVLLLVGAPILAFVTALAFYFVATSALPVSGVSSGSETGFRAAAGLFFVLLVLVPVVYRTVAEARFGRTLGKRFFHVEVTKADGSACGWRSALLRNLVRPLDYVGGFLLLLWRSDRRRRLGDLVAGTMVVRAESVDTGADAK
ncbi:hypothetical protein AUR64_11925 [Haloprofundus marisrubri]|uniref:RDD domain-containing protein n=1 Tax=Haloprofundus marisrubri TaxID=1514971 RepID=A0A0W1RA12_9EURY|nr:RDD family protein [Haloprofundus marisrubri]KTG10280.1 hypothetical protein AUR64_11925 [Haloprofundus marisrubri]